MGCSWSHPVRVRGLKLMCIYHSVPLLDVAPRAGAWIETNKSHTDQQIASVAPRAGAWIETKQNQL